MITERIIRGLSSHPSTSADEFENIEEESESQDMEKAQRQDPEIRLIMQLVEKFRRKPSWNEIPSSPAVKVYWGQWESLKIIHGKLYRHRTSRNSNETADRSKETSRSGTRTTTR